MTHAEAVIEAEKLENFIDGHIYSVTSNEYRGKQIAVVIPWDVWHETPGYRVLYVIVKHFIRTAFRLICS